MSELFLSVLNMSLTASYVIIFVVLVRLLLKKAPKISSYALWGVVAFRLIIPFSFESMFSLMPRNTNAVPIPHDIIYQQSPQISSGIEVVDSFVNQSLPAPTVGASVTPLQIYTEIAAYIWVIGIIALLVYSLVSILILKRQLKNAQLIEQNIFEAKNLKTPFVLGLIRPKIYLPVGLNIEERNYILLHEQTHIHRKDHIIKILAFLVLSIHWFNPLVWIAFMLMSTDMELSCDERVLKEMNEQIKKPYANSLLSFATGRYILNGSPLAFGEGNVRGRIKNVLNYKKPRFWVVLVSVIVLVGAGIALISNPAGSKAVFSTYLKDIPTMQLKYTIEGTTDKVTVKPGTSSWNYNNESIEIESPHPLDSVGFIPKIIKSDNLNEITVIFSSTPTSYTVRYWADNYIGNEKAYEDFYNVVEISNDIIVLPNGEPGYIYEIHAMWPQGNAYYAFYVTDINDNALNRETQSNPATEQSTDNVLNQLANQDFSIEGGNLRNADDETVVGFGKAFVNLFNGAVAEQKEVSFEKYISNKNLRKFTGKMLELTQKQDLLGGNAINYGLKNEFNKAKLQHMEDNLCYLELQFDSKGSGMGCKMLITTENNSLKLVDFYFGSKDGVDTFATGHPAEREIKDPNLWENEEWVKGVFDKLEDYEESLGS
ncbi:MAG: M56 family metallopeptidase [Dysgonamonadaceae bacterium]|nr:M56 family metallopeptidase [Dysgonamonadaceae bacterium]